MLKGSTLYSVVIISLVIGVMTTTIIVAAYFYRSQNYKNLLLARLELNAQSGIAYLLAEKEAIAYNEEKILDLYGEEKDSVSLIKRHWGLFEAGVVRSFSGTYSNTKAVLYGYKSSPEDPAIYLTDQGRPLFLCGSTIVKGKCFLPEAGVKRAFIEGQNYLGNELINGAIEKSGNSLPLLNKNQIDRILNILKSGNNNDYDVKEGFSGDTLVHSFFDTTLFIGLKDSLPIRRKNLSGNIILFSTKLMILDSSCRMEDVIIFAPSVIIKEGFKGSLQVFAKDSLIVEKNCELKYPSALGLFKIDVKTHQPFIRIESNSAVRGIVFTAQELTDIDKTKVSILEKSEVEGQVYADGSLELKGYVYGNVYCNKFLLRTPSSIYENHLLNVTIDKTKLSPYFVGSSLIYSENQKQVAKWLE